MIKKNRSFGLIVGGVFIAYAAGQYLLKGKHSFIVSGVGLLLLLLAWLKPYWLAPLQIAWEKIGGIMGIVNTYVLLTIFYFLVLSPLGFLRRLFGKQKNRFSNHSTTTYWQAHSANDDNQFKNQY